MIVKNISELITITELCTKSEIQSLIKIILDEKTVDFSMLPLNSRAKNELIGYLRQTDFENIKIHWLGILLSYERLNSSDIYPVFTAPNKYKPAIYETKSEMIQLITGAEKSIYLFGFWLTSNANDIMASLAQAANRGVKIIIIADSIDNFVKPFMKIWNSALKPSFYIIKKSNGLPDDIKMHAKTLIVDERRLLLTSANLTYLGLNQNLEIGAVIINQPVAEKICEVLAHLIHDDSCFERYKL